MTRRSHTRALVLIAVAFAMLAVLPSARAGTVRIITEEFPPYDFTGDGGTVEGLSTDVVREVLADLGIAAEIEVYPWARAFKMASGNPNTLLFSVVRTPEREAMFHWVGIVCEVKSYLFRLHSRNDIDAATLAGLTDYSIGVVRGWAGQKFLEQHGFERLQKVANSDLNIKKLIGGRVDLIEDYEANLVFRMKKLRLEPRLVDKVHFNQEISGPLYAVFSKNTSDTVVRRFMRSFADVHRDGRYDEIQRRWRDLN